MSDHEGVKCVLMLKTPCKRQKSFLVRNYESATYNVMQQMVDKSADLQTLFADNDPDVIAAKLVKGMKIITDKVVRKKRVQITNRGVKFWSKKLESERMKVAELNRVAIAT